MEAKKLLNELMVELNCEEMFNVEGGKLTVEEAQDIAGGVASVWREIFSMFPNCVEQAYKAGELMKLYAELEGVCSNSTKPQTGYGCTAR